MQVDAVLMMIIAEDFGWERRLGMVAEVAVTEMG